MSMRLDDVIRGLSRDNTVAALQQVLNSAKVEISWYGRRVVSVEGYEGNIELRELALKYFAATPFQWPEENFTFSERWECYLLYTKIEKLFSDGAEAFENTWVYQYILPYKESTSTSDREIICKKLFKYTPEQFRTTFPSGGSYEKEVFNGTEIEIWIPVWRTILSAVSRLNLSSS